MNDIDELDELMAAGTPGEWVRGKFFDLAIMQNGLDGYGVAFCYPPHDEAAKSLNDPRVYQKWDRDASLIVALHNAYPQLAAELRAARAVCELITLWAGVEMTTLHPDIAKALRKWQKARGEE